MGEHVKVALPLSLTLSGELLAAIGARWPNAAIVTDTGEDRFMVIDPHGNTGGTSVRDAARNMGADTGELTAAPSAGDVEAFLTSVRDGSLGISTPEWYAQMMFGAFRDILDSADAPNYVEQSLYSVDTNETYVVTVGRPGGKTPHQLRVEAEERAAAADAALAEIVAAHGVARTDHGWEGPTGPLSGAAGDAIDSALEASA